MVVIEFTAPNLRNSQPTATQKIGLTAIQNKRTAKMNAPYAWASELNAYSSTSQEQGEDVGLSTFLRDVAQYPLLTASEERALAEAIARGREAADRLHQLPPEAPERMELERLVKAGKEAQNRLVQSNLRLVLNLAHNYRGRGLPFWDLVQEGSLGLIRAAEKFDPSYGSRFSTYATWWIRQAMMRALSDKGRIVRLPAHAIETLTRIQIASMELASELGREPTPAEIAGRLGLPEEKVIELLRAQEQPVRLEAPIGEDDLSLEDLLEDREVKQPEDIDKELDLKHEVEALLEELTPRERRVLELRYGLTGDHERTLAEVGAIMGISRERVRQIEAVALRKLRSLHSRRNKRVGQAIHSHLPSLAAAS